MTPEKLKAWRMTLRPDRGKVCSRSEAARRLRVPPATYDGWEKGERRIPGHIGLACQAVSNGLPPWGGDD